MGRCGDAKAGILVVPKLGRTPSSARKRASRGQISGHFGPVTALLPFFPAPNEPFSCSSALSQVLRVGYRGEEQVTCALAHGGLGVTKHRLGDLLEMAVLGALGFEFDAAAGWVSGIIIPAEGVGFYGAEGLLEQKLLVVKPVVCLPLYWKRRLGGDITAS